MVRALQVVTGEGAAIRDLPEDAIGDGDTVVAVSWSGVNYKDAIALTGRPGILRGDRRIPGIDLVGTVASTESDAVRVGDRVLVNGQGLGEGHDGGLSELARVPAEWLVPVPDAFSDRQAAAIGTAGFTAALSVDALIAAGVPTNGEPVVVTGSTGGVGSIAIALLARAGYTVTAVTGKESEHDYLRGLGATEILDRATLTEPGKPLQGQRFAAVVDTVGGDLLANLLAQLRYGGVAAVSGMAATTALRGTILPFILRGVTMVGINSVDCPRIPRLAAWERLARDLDTDLLDRLTTEVPLDGAVAEAERIIAGGGRGRTVVDVRS